MTQIAHNTHTTIGCWIVWRCGMAEQQTQTFSQLAQLIIHHIRLNLNPNIDWVSARRSVVFRWNAISLKIANESFSLNSNSVPNTLTKLQDAQIEWNGKCALHSALWCSRVTSVSSFRIVCWYRSSYSVWFCGLHLWCTWYGSMTFCQ